MPAGCCQVLQSALTIRLFYASIGSVYGDLFRFPSLRADLSRPFDTRLVFSPYLPPPSITEIYPRVRSRYIPSVIPIPPSQEWIPSSSSQEGPTLSKGPEPPNDGSRGQDDMGIATCSIRGPIGTGCGTGVDTPWKEMGFPSRRYPLLLEGG